MSPKANSRREVTACYDHLGGKLGEALFKRLIALGWFDVHGERLTLEGVRGLSAWGVEIDRLYGSNRKPLNLCVERHSGQHFNHIGSHLGSLIRQWMDRNGWIVAADGGLYVTETGRRGLSEHGITWD